MELQLHKEWQEDIIRGALLRLEDMMAVNEFTAHQVVVRSDGRWLVEDQSGYSYLAKMGHNVRVGDTVFVNDDGEVEQYFPQMSAQQDHSQDGWYYNDTVKHSQWEHWVGGNQIDYADDGSRVGDAVEAGSKGLIIVPKPGTTSTVAAPAGSGLNKTPDPNDPRFSFFTYGAIDWTGTISGSSRSKQEEDKPKPIPWTDCSICGKKATLSPNQPSENLLNFRCTNLLGCGEVTAKRKDSRHIHDYVPEEE